VLTGSIKKGYSAMATVLSYARPEGGWHRRCFGPIAIFVAVFGSCSIVGVTFIMRYALASHVQVGRCGTPHATLEMQLYALPAILFVPCEIAAGVAGHLQYRVAVTRVSLSVAVLGWAVCAFVG